MWRNFWIGEEYHSNKGKKADGEKRIKDLPKVIAVFGNAPLNFFIQQPVSPNHIKQQEGNTRNHKITAADQPDTF